MKKSTHTRATLLLALILLSAIALPISASSAPLSPALSNIAADAQMVKTGLKYNPVTFTREDFCLATGNDELKSVTITALPSPEDGKLTLGDRVITENQSIKAKNLSSLKYMPSEGVGEGSFRFTTEHGYDIECVIRLTELNNSTPTASGAARDVWTQRDVTVFGRLTASDPDGDRLTYEITDRPGKGLVILTDASAGTFKYTPYENAEGKDCFSYRVRDEYGNYSEEAAVIVALRRPEAELVIADMDGHWAHNAAMLAVARGYMSCKGFDDELVFEPDAAVTRAEFLVSVMDCLGADNLPSVSKTVFDDDSLLTDRERGYVYAAYRLGIIEGTETDGKLLFDPDGAITRAEAAVILNRIICAEAPEVAPVWSDLDSVPAWAKSSLQAMHSLGIITGTGDGAVSANTVIDRAQAAQILLNLSEIFDV